MEPTNSDKIRQMFWLATMINSLTIIAFELLVIVILRAIL